MGDLLQMLERKWRIEDFGPVYAQSKEEASLMFHDMRRMLMQADSRKASEDDNLG